MKVLFLGEALTFSLIPRDYPIITDTVTIDLRNEMSDLVITPAITFTITQTLNITITAQPTDFKAKNKYELIVKNNGSAIFYDKIIVLESGTDVQNYEYGSQTNSRFEYKQ